MINYTESFMLLNQELASFEFESVYNISNRGRQDRDCLYVSIEHKRLGIKKDNIIVLLNIELSPKHQITYSLSCKSYYLNVFKTFKFPYQDTIKQSVKFLYKGLYWKSKQKLLLPITRYL